MIEVVRSARTSAGSLRSSTDGGHDPWPALLGTLLDRRQVQQLLGLEAGQDVGDLVARGQLLALPTDEGDLAFPAFQFGKGGKLDPTIGRVLAILGPVVATPYSIASWLRSPNDHLGGRTPSEWVELGKDPEPVIAAAELVAARLAL